MGWIYDQAIHYKRNGKIDVKAEIERKIDSEYRVLKSSVVGSAYYAAVQEPNGNVSGHVVLFNTDGDGSFNFGTKFMDETMGPCYYDCPKSILNLLTETDNEEAKAWRIKCATRNAQKARERDKVKRLKNLPLNTVIEFDSPFTSRDGATKKGDMVQLLKIVYRGKEIWFDGKYKWYPSLIPENFYTSLANREMRG